MQAYYERGEELDRLTAPRGRLEYLRTCELIVRHLPPGSLHVADVGGGPGRYTRWLADRGHHVVHRDPVPLHVDQVLRLCADLATGTVDAAVGDARSLDLAGASVDATLLLGPLYHLPERTDRLRALAEARRITRSGGVVFVAAISRWAPRLHSVVSDRLYLDEPDIVERLVDLERTGFIPPMFDGSFTGFTHRPDELRSEVADVGLQVLELVNVEGPAGLLPDLAARMTDPVDAEIVVAAARDLEAVPELLGAGQHLMVVARVP